ncbi:MAG: zinc ribbon domain-containing protein [Candidatus Firestonebacteria bacterium]
MPLYEYECNKCLNTFEVLQRKNVIKEKCPSCGGVSRKKMSAAGFVFKGSGFYVNDYKGKKEPEGKNAEKKAVKAAPDASKKSAETTKPVEKKQESSAKGNKSKHQNAK